ncbi:translation initiation factor IF-2 [Candidatus Curtissbacteria bacterium RIFCSPHIGHO2_01_FULL_41_13]|uniref:Translation initiation factor IF-2 n=1 Tax=Candidatus Curtissbacteria bacterium RIFCSPHIGHO2_01_FULL_41_13 TaxID=1797745 RepID=A0A1F5G1T8_9BACT|nr:MAG: translation initiation factor IF-2 [Candidatus Curtissbacteria bacterium RIFCSPHIGHO2_01_FULL_41_13]
MKDSSKDNLRPAVVTLMGHVDHGKTTLLDAIRKTNVVAREHGGITQHIGAYQIIFQGKPITFIDTPGHEAFEKMRSRGAEVADIVVLVVAANDGVKPQTVEAIKHIKNANKPIIVAITKTDLSDINLEKVKKELQTHNVVVEGYGGQVPAVEVAATKGQGINELLEVIQLFWHLSPEISLTSEPLEAVVIESYLDKSRGPIVSAIIKKGTLKIGQKILVDDDSITVRSLTDDQGLRVLEAEPGKPVEILGFKKVLEVGSILHDKVSTKQVTTQQSVTHADIIAKLREIKDKFKVIIKADVLGSLEAIQENLPEKILAISSGVGEVQPTDISFAKVAQAPILAFNVKTSNQIQSQAQREHIVIKNYDVIYELISDMQDIAKTYEQAKHEQKILGRAKIVAVFEVDGKKIAGVKVTQGKIKTGDLVFLISSSGQKTEAQISSLKKFKKDIEAVTAGQECGVGLVPNLDFKVGDIIESLG